MVHAVISLSIQTNWEPKESDIVVGFRSTAVIPKFLPQRYEYAAAWPGFVGV